MHHYNLTWCNQFLYTSIRFIPQPLQLDLVQPVPLHVDPVHPAATHTGQATRHFKYLSGATISARTQFSYTRC
ncbi:hypothetical protein DsansV1_C04g0047671 [Dioscorea sansibarensis]